MSHQHHKAHAPKKVRVYVITVSDTRTPETDTGGRLCRELCAAAGHEIAGSVIVPDEPAQVQAAIQSVTGAGSADVILTTGGTGISHRDSTYEAVSALIGKRLDGFGELFRMLSYQDIGSAAMLSRAVAGLYKDGGAVIFALPGSERAVRLALEKLIVPELGHLVFEAHR